MGRQKPYIWRLGARRVAIGARLTSTFPNIALDVYEHVKNEPGHVAIFEAYKTKDGRTEYTVSFGYDQKPVKN